MHTARGKLLHFAAASERGNGDNHQIDARIHHCIDIGEGPSAVLRGEGPGARRVAAATGRQRHFLTQRRHCISVAHGDAAAAQYADA